MDKKQECRQLLERFFNDQDQADPNCERSIAIANELHSQMLRYARADALSKHEIMSLAKSHTIRDWREQQETYGRDDR